MEHLRLYKMACRNCRKKEGQRKVAWVHYFQQRDELFELYGELSELKLDGENIEGLSPHLQTFIKDLYEKSKVKIQGQICLEEIEKDKLKTGKCGHNFHKDCITQWTSQAKKECPLCRGKF